MTKLIFVTHPSVAISAGVPIDEWPLSETGIAEAQELLTLPFWAEAKAVYTSTEPKAYTVAEMVRGRFGLPYTKVEAIKEVDRSAMKLLPRDEYMCVVEEFYQKPQENVRGWESAEHARQRMKAAIDEIMVAHSGEVVVVIGHGATGTLLACEVKKIASTFAEDPKRTGCVMQIDWDNQVILSPWEAYAERNQELRGEVGGAHLK